MGKNTRGLQGAFFSFGLAVAALGFTTLTIFPFPSVAATRTEIQSAQQTLVALGYHIGTPDGDIGPRTKKAIRSFQRHFGLRATGRLDAQTLKALNASNASGPTADNSLPTTSDAPEVAPNLNSSDDSGAGPWIVLVIVGGIALIAWRGRRPSPVSPITSTPIALVSAPRDPATPPTLAAPRVWSGVSAQQRRIQIALEASNSRRPRSEVERLEEARQAWVPAGQLVTVGSFSVGSGLLYVGLALSRRDGLGVENCLINPQLSISTNDRNDDGQGVPYYPSYAFLDPAARAAYLSWLSTGKCNPEAYIGYVFLYFYGLERRLFLDDSRDDAQAIAEEVRRLLEVYGRNHSFARYAGLLLDAAALRGGRIDPIASVDVRKTVWELPLSLRATIGSRIAGGEALGATEMLAWYCCHPEKRIPGNIAARCPDEFRVLFSRRFASQYPSGLKVTTPKRRLAASYKAASGTFSVALHGAFEAWPDITGLTAPLTAIQPIIDGCVAELASYAQRVGRVRDTRNAIDVALALPADLSDTAALQPLISLRQFCAKTVQGPTAMLSLSGLLAAASIETPDGTRPAKADLTLLARALGACGFGIEPDPRLGNARLAAEDVVAVFRATGLTRELEPTPHYLAAALLVDIGALVATADGVFAASELRAIQTDLSGNTNLNDLERARLLARTAYRTKNPAVLRDFKKLAGQPLDQRQRIVRFAVGIAAADDRIAVEEVRLLENLYRALDLPEAQLYSDLQGLGARADDLSAAGSARSVTAISATSTVSNAGTIRLDAQRLAQTRAETIQVGALLETIFVDEATMAQQTNHPVASASTAAAYDGLDARYSELARALEPHDTIAASAFADLAQAQGVLPEGALEALNDWAYQKFDQPLLEEGDPMIVNCSLLRQSLKDVA